MSLPFPNTDNRSLTMREQVIERLMEIDPSYRREYLESLKDFALLQALEVKVAVDSMREYEDYGREMFDAGMKYERQSNAQSVTETRRMNAGELIASSNDWK